MVKWKNKLNNISENNLDFIISLVCILVISLFPTILLFLNFLFPFVY